MSRRRLIADTREQARTCDTCGCWPAPIQWDKHTRLCEECRDRRRRSSEGVSSVSR
jgi:hypothetical protein